MEQVPKVYSYFWLRLEMKTTPPPPGQVQSPPTPHEAQSAVPDEVSLVQARGSATGVWEKPSQGSCSPTLSAVRCLRPVNTNAASCCTHFACSVCWLPLFKRLTDTAVLYQWNLNRKAGVHCLHTHTHTDRHTHSRIHMHTHTEGGNLHLDWPLFPIRNIGLVS